MNRTRPIAPLLLNSLSDELRQAGRWLGRQQHDPAPEQLLSRLHALREAAAVAGATELELALAALESKLPADSSPAPTTAQQLLELAGLLEEQETSQLHHVERWLDSTYQIPGKLELALEQVHDCRRQLRYWKTETQDGRTELTPRLLRGLFELEDRLGRLTDTLQRLLQRSRQQADHLAASLSKQMGLSAGPLLFRLGQRVRQLGQQYRRPTTLRCPDQDWHLAAGQLEALEELLAWLLERLLRLAVQSPEQRRRQGLPTVATIDLAVQQRPALLEFALSHDDAAAPLADEQWTLAKPLASRVKPLRVRLLVKERGLRLAVPQVWGVLQVVPVRSALGSLLLPLACLAEVPAPAPPEDIPRLRLERRAERSSQLGPVLVDSGYGRALVDIAVAGLPRWVSATAPGPESPDWVAGLATWENRPTPVIHPLYWMKDLEGEKCLLAAK